MNVKGLEKLRKILLKWSSGSIVYLSLIIYAFLSTVSFLSTAYFEMDYLETTYYKRDFIPLHLLVLFIFLFVLWWIEKKKGLENISSKKLCLLLLCYAALFSGIWSVVSHAVPTADQAKVADCAADFMRGEYYYFSPGKYMQIYPMQTGYVAFLEILFRVFGPFSYSMVEILNVCFICLEFYLIYKITDLVFKNRKVTNLALFLLFECMPYLFYATFIYGEMVGAPLALASVYGAIRFMEERKLVFGAMTALCLGAAVTIKQNFLITAIAIALYLLLKGLEQKKYTCLFVIAASILCMVSFDTGVKKQYELRSGYEIGSGVSPLLHIAMGMQEGEMAEGWYNGYILGTFWDCGEDMEKSAEKAAEDIHRSLNYFVDNPAYAAEFYYKKIVSQWNNPLYECLWISHFENAHDGPLPSVVQSLYVGKLHWIFLGFANEYHWILFAGACMGLWLYRKKYTLEQLFLALIILGGFFFHIIWEAKSRYILPYFVLFIPYAALGYQQFLLYLNRIKEG